MEKQYLIQEMVHIVNIYVKQCVTEFENSTEVLHLSIMTMESNCMFIFLAFFFLQENTILKSAISTEKLFLHSLSYFYAKLDRHIFEQINSTKLSNSVKILRTLE